MLFSQRFKIEVLFLPSNSLRPESQSDFVRIRMEKLAGPLRRNSKGSNGTAERGFMVDSTTVDKMSFQCERMGTI